jgi:hypothetical protein
LNLSFNIVFIKQILHSMNDRVLKTLLYFDLFSYPLNRDELFALIGSGKEDSYNLDAALDFYVEKGIINHSRGYYYLGNDISRIDNREDGNRRTFKKLKTARRFSRIISWFPFVRGVYLSGSISKGSMSRDDDIDYFIITSPGRLWIARTMLIVFKKLFLFNSYKNFCINYFIDSNHLNIKEQNRFTATEIVFLVPMYNLGLYHDFLLANQWIRLYYPVFRQKEHYVGNYSPLIKKWLEYAIDVFWGNTLESFLYKTSSKYIKQKFQYMSPDVFSVCFSMLRHELRYFPKFSNSLISDRFLDRIQSFEIETGMDVEPEPIFY